MGQVGQEGGPGGQVGQKGGQVGQVGQKGGQEGTREGVSWGTHLGGVGVRSPFKVFPRCDMRLKSTSDDRRISFRLY